MKKEVTRTCIVCRKKSDKNDFIRIVKSASGEISLDKSKKASGRGCYICNNDECLSKVKKTKALNRNYKTNISEDVYDSVLQAIKSNN